MGILTGWNSDDLDGFGIEFYQNAPAKGNSAAFEITDRQGRAKR
jgi:hypothetical protein